MEDEESETEDVPEFVPKTQAMTVVYSFLGFKKSKADHHMAKLAEPHLMLLVVNSAENVLEYQEWIMGFEASSTKNNHPQTPELAVQFLVPGHIFKCPWTKH